MINSRNKEKNRKSTFKNSFPHYKSVFIVKKEKEIEEDICFWENGDTSFYSFLFLSKTKNTENMQKANIRIFWKMKGRKAV